MFFKRLVRSTNALRFQIYRRALHKKGLTETKLVGSHERRASFVPRINRLLSDRQPNVFFLHLFIRDFAGSTYFFSNMPCMKRVYRDKQASVHWSAPRTKSARESANTPRVNRWLCSSIDSHRILFVLLKRRSEQLSSMSGGHNGRLSPGRTDGRRPVLPSFIILDQVSEWIAHAPIFGLRAIRLCCYILPPGG